VALIWNKPAKPGAAAANWTGAFCPLISTVTGLTGTLNGELAEFEAPRLS
jgi:hypothetical protein